MYTPLYFQKSATLHCDVNCIIIIILTIHMFFLPQPTDRDNAPSSSIVSVYSIQLILMVSVEWQLYHLILLLIPSLEY